MPRVGIRLEGANREEILAAASRLNIPADTLKFYNGRPPANKVLAYSNVSLTNDEVRGVANQQPQQRATPAPRQSSVYERPRNPEPAAYNEMRYQQEQERRVPTAQQLQRQEEQRRQAEAEARRQQEINRQIEQQRLDRLAAEQRERRERLERERRDYELAEANRRRIAELERQQAEEQRLRDIADQAKADAHNAAQVDEFEAKPANIRIVRRNKNEEA